MAEFSDPPSPNLYSSPKLAKPNNTLDGSSPTASIKNLADHSLSVSSPIHQIQASSAAKSDGSSPYRFSETLTFNSEDDIDISDEDSDTSSEDTDVSEEDSDTNLDGSSSSPSDKTQVTLAKPYQFSWWTPKNTGAGAGLHNSGNTCFIASVLQCFTHMVPLIESFRSYTQQSPCICGNEKFCVMQALRYHMNYALSFSGSELNVDIFRDNLKHFSSDFEIGQQEDAHEFLQSFLDKLERCCFDSRISSQDLNIVENVFGGRLMSMLRCCNCNSVSNTFEPSLGWSLEIEDVDNLCNALESFTSVEKLEDQLTCDHCKEKVTKEKQLKFDKLPPVVTFHLKRFKNDGVTMEKISKHVEFPLELDLLPYMSSNQNSEVSTKYNLYAFVEHIGATATFGHYSSYVRSAPETWHHFDDEKVTRISEDSVLPKDAYILFYTREGTPWFSSTFVQLQREFDASPSPNSVLDNSYKSVGNSNKACKDSVGVSTPDVYCPDLRCHESIEEVFQSAESSNNEESMVMINALKSPEAHESEVPFAETDSQQRDPDSCPAGNKASTDESEKQYVETSQQKKLESSPAADGVSTDAIHVPLLKVQSQDLSPRLKAGERAMIGGAYETKLKNQKQNSPPRLKEAFRSNKRRR